MDEIKWHCSEHDDHPESGTAYLAGYVADVYPDETGWFWRVDVTSEISEYPETVDCGFTATAGLAKIEALQVLRNAAEDWQDARDAGYGDSKERG